MKILQSFFKLFNNSIHAGKLGRRINKHIFQKILKIVYVCDSLELIIVPYRATFFTQTVTYQIQTFLLKIYWEHSTYRIIVLLSKT
jgi:hypothetical protein